MLEPESGSLASPARTASPPTGAEERLTQEALRNACKHADPDTVSIAITAGEREATLEVEDDGSGFDPASAPREGHFGLRLLDDLARAARGRLELDSAPGKGTRVRVSVPLR
jgi:signal transduction histidine kinase